MPTAFWGGLMRVMRPAMIALLLCTSPTLLWAELPKQPAPVVEVDNVVQTAATSLSTTPGLILVQHASKLEMPESVGLHSRLKQRHYGGTALTLYKSDTEDRH